MGEGEEREEGGERSLPFSGLLPSAHMVGARAGPKAKAGNKGLNSGLPCR